VPSAGPVQDCFCQPGVLFASRSPISPGGMISDFEQRQAVAHVVLSIGANRLRQRRSRAAGQRCAASRDDRWRAAGILRNYYRFWFWPWCWSSGSRIWPRISPAGKFIVWTFT